MLAAAVMLASWVAQAPETGRLPPPQQPAPPIPRAPLDDAEPDAPNAFGVLARFAYRRATEGPSLGPAEGYSLGATFERRYATIGPEIDLGAVVDLFHDHFSTGVQGVEEVSPGVEQAVDGQRVVSQTSFVVLHTFARRLGPVRPWVGLGGGLTVAFLSSPERDLRPGSKSAVQPLARAGVGLEIKLRGRAALAVRADYSHPLTSPTFRTDQGQTYRPFGDLVDGGLGLVYRF